MGKIVFLSNRLPTTVKRNEEGSLVYEESIGGLSTGLKSFHQEADSIWIGWPGILEEDITGEEKQEIKKTLRDKYQCIPVFLSKEEIDEYYHGCSNRTIWPLFHYFIGKTEYDPSNWETYCEVNRKYFETTEEYLDSEDVIWVHDYHLFLVPELLREGYPQLKIGFFLHIPFPSFEVFRLLIWRKEILKGLLGADLIGFHTYEYMWYFLTCVRRLLGCEDVLDKIIYNGRYVHVNAFPMGIDYERFFNYQIEPGVAENPDFSLENGEGMKTILSVDRLDYSKGIPQRLKAFECLLKRYPEYKEKVTFYLIVAPSRVEVEAYHQLLKEIRELVSEINGRFGTMDWMPVWFFFRPFTQEMLINYYRQADILLVTPLRDGMNLVAKEYIAARNDYRGMVVISETAGAANELGEAIIVNPNDYRHTAAGIKAALEMPEEEQEVRNRIIHQRLKRYNVDFWGEEFLRALRWTEIYALEAGLPRHIKEDLEQIKKAWCQAKKRLLLLDYDGTLVDFTSVPEEAKPDLELRKLLNEAAEDLKNTVVIISGRERQNLLRWLGDIHLHLVASHGLWIRNPGQQEEWSMTAYQDEGWKNVVLPILETYTDRIPGSFIEDKVYSLAWHYRQCDPIIIEAKLPEIRETLNRILQSTNLGIQEGKKVLEVKDRTVNKGQAATYFLNCDQYDFILALGDDYTDEHMFTMLPKETYTVKVGLGKTAARYRTDTWLTARMILKKLIQS